MLMASLRESSVSKSTSSIPCSEQNASSGYFSVAITVMPREAHRTAMLRPIRPRPKIPIVCPRIGRIGSVLQPPERTSLS